MKDKGGQIYTSCNECEFEDVVIVPKIQRWLNETEINMGQSCNNQECLSWTSTIVKVRIA